MFTSRLWQKKNLQVGFGQKQKVTTRFFFFAGKVTTRFCPKKKTYKFGTEDLFGFKPQFAKPKCGEPQKYG
jgi:hypothetical protein